MQITSTDFIRAILLKEDFNNRTQIRESFSKHLANHKDVPMSVKLSVGVLLLKELSNKHRTIDGFNDILNEKFDNVLKIILEHDIKLPEEESELEACVSKIFEEGEGAAPAAPTNVTSGIEPGTPRIKKKKVDDV